MNIAHFLETYRPETQETADLMSVIHQLSQEHEQERAGLLLKIGAMQEELEKLRMDGRRLDWLEQQGNGDRWAARQSGHGRGFRLHNTSFPGFLTARNAIDAAIRSQGDIGSSSNPPAQTVPAMECSTNGGGQVASPSIETTMALLSLAATVGLIVAGLKGVL